ncbi:MAG: Holliday junction resolvase RuvX [Clostridia bacterium]|nr:Holliday junction resolvase RuvX [Clostridia bacterium]
MGKLMGIDFGDVRTGVATSDPTGLIASGAGCIQSTNLRRTAEIAAEMAKEKGVTAIVVGHPINMNGTLGPRSERVRAFAAILSELTELPVILHDERLSTAQAHQMLNLTSTHGKKRKAVIDEMSACLILQNYMDQQRNMK